MLSIALIGTGEVIESFRGNVGGSFQDQRKTKQKNRNKVAGFRRSKSFSCCESISESTSNFRLIVFQPQALLSLFML
jgi:hypothetical protein